MTKPLNMSKVFGNSASVRNPYLIFSPFLIFFIGYVIYFMTDGVSGDQPRYLMYADNLIHGFYSPPELDLRNGPGYPIVLIPLVVLNLPFVAITILNAILHYLSIVFLFKALQQIVSHRKAFFISLFWACYYIGYQYMSAISYEPISIFLVALLVLCLTRAFMLDDPKKMKRYVYLSGFVLGYLALTKVIFGYVLFIMLLGCGLLWIMNKAVTNYRKGALIMLIACLVTVPYLVYTYHQTGRVFYWGTGQENLYWMTTPYEGEYGDWKGDLTQNPVDLGNYNTVDAGDSLKAHHQRDYDTIYQYKGLERDDAFKKIAINNIKTHPFKYVRNIAYNIGRIFFHYPFSYATQRTKILLVYPLNGIVLTLILVCLVPTVRNWRKIIYPVRFMLIVGILYLAENTLLSSEVRVLALVVPIILWWGGYILERSVKINLKFFDNANKGNSFSPVIPKKHKEAVETSDRKQ